MTTFTLDDFTGWPPGVSDGLARRCARCGERASFDYYVDDEFWRQIVPRCWSADVLCLLCLDELAENAGRELADYLREVQFIGCESTIFLAPSVVVRRERKQHEP